MRGLIFAVCLVVMGGACGLQQRSDVHNGPVSYVVTADGNGWASVRVDNHTPGDVLSVEAWRLDKECCNAVVWRSIPDVIVQYDGLIKALTEPGAEVVFVVDVFD